MRGYIKKLPKFDLIIDCCAEASVEISRKDLDRVFNTNLIGTFNILKKTKPFVLKSNLLNIDIVTKNDFQHAKNLFKKKHLCIR